MYPLGRSLALVSDSDQASIQDFHERQGFALAFLLDYIYEIDYIRCIKLLLKARQF